MIMKPAPSTSAYRTRAAAFTLVELLVTITILTLLMTLVSEVISRTQNVVSNARSRTEAFQEARAAFESLTANLAQSTMDAVWAYHWNTNVNNSYFKRESDQHFVLGPNSDVLTGNSEVSQAVFFQAPLGFAGSMAGETGTVSAQLNQSQEILNCWGYYIAYGSDLDQRPTFLKTGAAALINPERQRFRLMEFRLPAEQSQLYDMELGSASKTGSCGWFRGPFADSSTLEDHSTPIAENVLAMILVPNSIQTESELKGDTTSQFVPEEDYSYNSRQFQWEPSTLKAQRTRHQLPAMVQVTLIVTDEPSFQRFELRQGSPTAAATALRSIFAGKFENHTQHESDMNAVENALNQEQLNYKILSNSVALRGAKWITDQEM